MCMVSIVKNPKLCILRLKFRCYVSVVELDGLIYAMGGFDGQLRLHSAERFNRKTNQWSFISSMNHQRSDARATSMGGTYVSPICLVKNKLGVL